MTIEKDIPEKYNWLIKYPFANLKPGENIKIPITGEKQAHLVRCALYQYKKSNSLSWETATRTEGEYILVYRIK